MGILQSFAKISLALILVVTAQAAAFARGQAPAEDRAVICAGSTTITVYLDAEGQPTAAPELCADAAQALFAAHMGEPAAVTATRGVHRDAPIWHAVHVAKRALPGSTARGPPAI